MSTTATWLVCNFTNLNYHSRSFNSTMFTLFISSRSRRGPEFFAVCLSLGSVTKYLKRFFELKWTRLTRVL